MSEIDWYLYVQPEMLRKRSITSRSRMLRKSAAEAVRFSSVQLLPQSCCCKVATLT